MNVTLIGLILITIIILFSGFNRQGQPTCNHFIFNTYAYLLFMILFLYTIHLQIIQHKSFTKTLINQPGYSLISFLINIGLLIALLMTNAKNATTKHVLLFAWLISFALLTFPMTLRAQSLSTESLTRIVTIFFSLIFAATGITILFPKLITNKLGFPLLLGLTGLILAQILLLIFTPKSSQISQKTAALTRTAQTSITYFAIILFTIFISYDTHLAIEASKHCIEGQADYIQYSLGLFLDTVNLFINLENTR